MITTQKLSLRPSRHEPTITPSTPQPTVYVVDDDEAQRKSMRWLVETLDVPVKTFPSAASFLEEYEAQAPGCLVVDLMMPEMNGLELQDELRRRGFEIPVIVLTGYGDVSAVVRSLKNGAIDFLEKPVKDDKLLAQIRRGLALDATRRQERGDLAFVRERLARLTPRERDVLSPVVEGLTSKEIAARLCLSFKTVEAHRANIMKKMAAVSVAHLVRMVVSVRPLVGRDKPCP
jgi:two-component system, LuxR family, response regulator FixJ